MHNSFRPITIAILLVSALTLGAPLALGDVTCVAAKSSLVKGKIVTTLSTRKRSTSCKAGEVPALSGPTGANGQLRIYGNGSAGDLVVTTHGQLFTDFGTDGNTQFKSITVETGALMNVPAGTILRATGDVTIKGLLLVSVQGYGGVLHNLSGAISTNTPGYQQPSIGVARNAPSMGEIGTSAAPRGGGRCGFAHDNPHRTISDNLLRGGGGGAGARPNSFGGVGGGSVMIIAGGAITITSQGDIQANAFTPGADGDGVGGGGGGVVVLAAKQSITQAGDIYARGSRGNQGGEYSGTGGGGGGGIIILAAPSITKTGLTFVEGGQGGYSVPAGEITQSPRIGGGGGGASGGRGGIGSGVATNGSSGAGEDGQSGVFYMLNVDPTALF